jgi:hypothetical protein
MLAMWSFQDLIIWRAGQNLSMKAGFWNVGERYVTIDMDEGPLGHEWLEIVGARVLLLVAGDVLVVPKLINFPSRTCQHQ